MSARAIAPILLAALGALSAAASALAKEPIQILYHDRAPFHAQTPTGDVAGVLVAPTEQAFSQARIAHQWVKMPANRILARIRQGGPYCSPGWYQTPERARFAKFTRPIRQTTSGYALVGPGVAAEGPVRLSKLLQGTAVLYVKDGMTFGGEAERLIAGIDPGRLRRVAQENADIARLVVSAGDAFMLVDQDEVQALAGPRLRAMPLADIHDIPPTHIMCSASVDDEDMARLDAAIPEPEPAARGFGLNLVTEDYPPFNMRDQKTGAVIGVATDVVVAALDRLGAHYKIQVLPWPRVVFNTRNSEMTCAFSVTRLPERETWFRWIAPIVNNDWALFARADWAPPMLKIADARPFLIGTALGHAVEEQLKADGFRTQAVNQDAQNIDKLMAGRIDLWATGGMAGDYLLGAAGIRSIVKILTFRAQPLYLACHPALPEPIVEALTQSLIRLRGDGTLDAARARYGLTGPEEPPRSN